MILHQFHMQNIFIIFEFLFYFRRTLYNVILRDAKNITKNKCYNVDNYTFHGF